ncbi:MAG: 5-formyltetrahydrofolate cyclo-ligase [Chlamydiales bacterium]
MNSLIKTDKQLWRNVFRSIRKEISDHRRIEAAHHLYLKLRTSIPPHGLVLSYASFSHELCTKALNEWLIKEGRLALPRVEGMHLHVYQVTHHTQLRSSQWGIPEPIPARCKEIELNSLSLVVIPALAFDKTGHRLGYGKGYYDRFMSRLSSRTHLCGVAFEEQLSTKVLPTHPHDRKVPHVLFV